MLVRYNIKNVLTPQIKEIAENCGRATFIVSPSGLNAWNVSVCLNESEIKNLRNLGFMFEKVPG